MSGEVIYIRGRSEVLSELVALLQEGGCTVAIVSSVDECSKRVGEGTAFVFVDASSGGTEASTRLHELGACKNLFEIPIIFVCTKAQKRIAPLKEDFKTVIPVEFPFRVRNLTEKLISSFIADEGRKENFKVHSCQERGEEEQPEDAALERERLEKETNQRSKLLKNLDPACLMSTYGGSQLANGSKSEDFDDELLVPNHPHKSGIHRAIKEMTDANEELSGHIRRVAFAASAIANSLAFGPERDNNIRTASLMLNLGTIKSRKANGHTFDLLKDLKEEEREEVLESLAQSVTYCREELKDEMASRTLETIMAIIRRERISEHSQIVQDAQCALVMEAVDRAVWSSGHWNPLGLYRSLRCIKQRRPFAVDPTIGEAAARMLGEAACARATKGGSHIAKVKEKHSEAPSEERALEEAERLFGYDSLINVDLFNLKPGMRLVRPVIAYDGTVILTADVKLDKEIISRLWQLAAIRPLRSPVAIAGNVVPA